MGKPGEPDNLASRADPGTRCDRSLPLWVSRLKGRKAQNLPRIIQSS